MELLPCVIQDRIFLPKYYRLNGGKSLNEKIFLYFELKNKKKLVDEFNEELNIYNLNKNKLINTYDNVDYYYLYKKGLCSFILYNLLKKKNRSVKHLVDVNIDVNYDFLNFVLYNYRQINNSNNSEIESMIYNNYVIV